MKFWNKEKPLKEIINENKIVILEFGTNVCSACIGLKGKLSQWLKENPDIQGYYISIDANGKEVADFGVFSGPTIQVFVNGKLTIRESGYFSLEQIIEKIQRYREIIE